MESPPGYTRRSFLSGGARLPSPLRPPGATTAGLDRCSGCSACVEACPTGIVALSEGLPVVSFALGACTLCGACAAACPEPVFECGSPIAFLHVGAISEACLAKGGIACMTCRDACPQDAIRFRPRVGGPFTPEVLADACNGCGACVAPCPAGAIRMVGRHPEPVHA
ncbi:ferredoxin-type protein NapF [Mesorhizobium sp. 1B3]|uniref:ferredoxin-type protein NapF n=1 Tax=Mesorhizobium sp. 1B3 TaxID=3243599 RepID=UPI003D98EC35